MLPISGGIEFSTENFATMFANNGYNCAIVRRIKIDKKRKKTDL